MRFERLRRTSMRAPALVLPVFIATIVMFIAVGGGDALAQRPTPERVAGAVSNGTDGAEIPEGFEISLLATRDGAIIEQRSVRVGPDDPLFEFTDLLQDEDVLYRLAWEYEGVTDMIFMEDEVAPVNLPIVIYEITDSLDNIRITAHATIIPTVVGSDRLMGVLDLVTLRNDGDRTFVPDPTNPNFTGLNMIRFSLPEGYEDLAVDSVLPQGQMLEIPTGFAMTNPVPPGQHEILYSYAINYTGDSLEFTRTLAFGADELRVLMPPDLGTVVGEGLARTRTTDLGDTTYAEFAGSGYAPGFKMNFAIKNLPQPGLFKRMNEAIPGGDAVVFGLPLLIAAAMAGLVVYVLVTSRRRRLALAVSPAERMEILQEIVELDERLEAGQIDAEEHGTRRDALTARALAGMEEAEPANDARSAVDAVAEFEPGNEDRRSV
ncbi:MAG: hypothetical protein IIB26_02435 [Chloroflexi bacterium]|nr:hypothetical protein [Chloroflexota bacterium]